MYTPTICTPDPFCGPPVSLLPDNTQHPIHVALVVDSLSDILCTEFDTNITDTSSQKEKYIRVCEIIDIVCLEMAINVTYLHKAC